MAQIVESIEIARSPEDVGAYLDDLEKHGEWQSAIVAVTMLTEGPVRVGTRGVEKRRVAPGINVKSTYEIVEYDPQKWFRYQVRSGPVRPAGTVRVEPLGGGTGSRVTLELDFVGRGIGKLFAPIARRQAAKEVPADLLNLRQRLEGDA